MFASPNCLWFKNPHTTFGLLVLFTCLLVLFACLLVLFACLLVLFIAFVLFFLFVEEAGHQLLRKIHRPWESVLQLGITT